MRRILIVGFLLFILSGCTAQETFETLGDVYAQLPPNEPAEVVYVLPEDAATPVFHGDGGKMYFCDGYEIMVETLNGGDLNRTVSTLTGYGVDSLTILQSSNAQPQRYECVWTAAGEGGDQVGRMVILDDGSYHYCISFMADADEAAACTAEWQSVLDSLALAEN